MPYYDLRCEACKHEFNVKATVQERTEGHISCPSCGSKSLATIYRKVNVLQYRGKDCDACPSTDSPARGGGCCGGACGHRH